MGRYSDVPTLMSLLATIMALIGAYMVSMNKDMFKAHVIYTIANFTFVVFYGIVQLWEPMFLCIGFLLTSVTGCIKHKKRVNTPNKQ